MSKPFSNEIFSLPIHEFIQYIKTAPIHTLKELLKEKEIILKQPMHIFNIIALNVPTEIKKQMFEDPIYFEKIKQIKTNKIKKSYFELLTEEEKLEFLKHLDAEETLKYISLLDPLEQKKLNLEQLPISNIEFLEQLKTEWNLSEQFMQQIKTKIEQKNRNIFDYLSVQNQNELLLYHKFGLLIPLTQFDDSKENVCLKDQTILSMEKLLKLNSKHMNLIIETIKKTDPKETDHTKILIASLKLYEIFGFDNAIKILNQKFTYMTPSAYQKFAEIRFVSIRRQYRLNNQEKFYSYEVLQQTKKAIEDENIYNFRNICKNTNPKYLQQFYNRIKNQTEEELSQTIQLEIKEREENLKKQFTSESMKTDSSKKQRGPLTCNEIYQKLKDCTYQPELNEKGQVIKNPELTKFLLGNEKYDNDCLFRLIVNQKAFGLNENLSIIINSFDTVKKITSRKTNTLSMFSILDVIDICKSTLYKLAPNEQDMSLESITKISNTNQFCTEPKQKILKRAKKLHVDRKKKYYSSIPTVSGITNQNIRYQVLNFDNENLITVGIDTGCCLRVGGMGEDFLRYCMTNPHAIIVGLWDQNNQFYICPFIRNGNGIYGNGIDPKPEDARTMQNLLDALQICTNHIMQKSIQSEKIEFSCITDLHQKMFFEESGLPSLETNIYLPLEEKFYSDYHKKERKLYIISKDVSYQEPKFYSPTHKYFQSRPLNYIYNANIKEEKIKIENIINSIKYEHIDIRSHLKKEQKLSAKRKFVPMDIHDYQYIIGNKDWFIAIDQYNCIESYCLPYDPRANIEYKEALGQLEELYRTSIERKLL